MSILKAGHLLIGAGLVAFAVASTTWIFVPVGIAFAALGWFGLCPMYRLIARFRS